MARKNGLKKKIKKHLKGDIKMYKKEAAEDKDLIKTLDRKKSKKDPKPKSKKGKEDKVEKVMHEFKEGELHSGSKKGPKVKSRKQAIAIAMSEAGMAKKKKRKK